MGAASGCWLNGLDFETIGYGIVAIFVVSWVISMAYWKLNRFEQRYASVIGAAQTQ